MSLVQYSTHNREILRERESGSSLEDLACKYGLRRATVKALPTVEQQRRTFQRLQLLAQAG